MVGKKIKTFIFQIFIFNFKLRWTDCYSPSSAQNFIGMDKECAQLSKNGLIKVNCFFNRARFICEQNIEDNEEMFNMRTGLTLKIGQGKIKT